MNVETIHEEWGSVYLRNHRAKAHLYEDCQYVKNQDLEPEDIAKYPPGHLDFCEECKEYFRRWRENTQGDASQCERCGKKGTKNKYCMTCFTRIRHKKAKKRL